MLERLLPRWGGKLLVLVLLGFAATDFMITMTLSAADATAHVDREPARPAWLQGQNVAVTLFLLALLGRRVPARVQGGHRRRRRPGRHLPGLNVVVVATSLFRVPPTRSPSATGGRP